MSTSELAVVAKEPTPVHNIPYRHSEFQRYVEWVEAQYALRVFENQEQQRRKDEQTFGAGCVAFVRSNPEIPNSATLWVDSKIREVYYGQFAWRNATVEAARINDLAKNQKPIS